MTDNIDFVITDKKWSDEMAKIKQENPNLIFVSPDWIQACQRRQKLINPSTFELHD